RITLGAWVALPALLLFLGCGKANHSERNTVSGVVTLSGRPFEDGIVTLYGPAGEQATGAILPGGRYSIDDPPLGQCEVTVTPPPGFTSPNFSQGADAHSPPKEKASPIPQKYRNRGNGLTVDVKPGGTIFNIAMVP